MSISSETRLRWRRVALWDLSQHEQVLFEADDDDCRRYKISRSGTADKPTWTLYACYPCRRWCEGRLLRDVKYAAEDARRALADLR